MTRLFGLGFEWQSNTSGVEAQTFTGTTSISTAIKNGGAASMRSNPTAATGYVQHQFRADAVADAYVKCYLYIATLPGATVTIMAYGDSSDFYGSKVRLRSDGKLESNQSDLSSPVTGTTTLSTATWYLVEMFYNETTNQVTVKLNGVEEIAASTVNDIGGGGRIRIGCSDSATADLYFDDIVVDNAAYPGPSKIVIAVPTGAGDSAATTGTASMIAEIPPSNTLTSGATMIELDANPTIGSYAMTDSGTMGIGSADAIKMVYILARMREDTVGTTNYTLRLKSASGGTTSVSASVDAGDATTVRTNPSSTTAFGNSLISVTDPTTGVAWTPTGTNSIDNMQAGVGTTDGSPDTWCATLCAMVEYIPKATAALTGTVTASITEADIVTGGKTIILTLANDFWLPAGTLFDNQRDEIALGIDSAQSEGTGWDAVVKVGIDVGDVVRTSSTVVTITLDAEATYNITAQETITATIPSTATAYGNTIIATPTFTVDVDGGAPATAIKDIIGMGVVPFPR